MWSALEEGPRWFSVISFWEVMLKSMKGTLEVGDPGEWWRETVDALAVQVLQLRPEHVSRIQHLAPLHQDPFDRALIAQATVENLAFLTTDREIPRYASDMFRVIE